MKTILFICAVGALGAPLCPSVGLAIDQIASLPIKLPVNWIAKDFISIGPECFKGFVPPSGRYSRDKTQASIEQWVKNEQCPFITGPINHESLNDPDFKIEVAQIEVTTPRFIVVSFRNLKSAIAPVPTTYQYLLTLADGAGEPLVKEELLKNQLAPWEQEAYDRYILVQDAGERRPPIEYEGIAYTSSASAENNKSEIKPQVSWDFEALAELKQQQTPTNPVFVDPNGWIRDLTLNVVPLKEQLPFGSYYGDEMLESLNQLTNAILQIDRQNQSIPIELLRPEELEQILQQSIAQMQEKLQLWVDENRDRSDRAESGSAFIDEVVFRIGTEDGRRISITEFGVGLMGAAAVKTAVWGGLMGPIWFTTSMVGAVTYGEVALMGIGAIIIGTQIYFIVSDETLSIYQRNRQLSHLGLGTSFATLGGIAGSKFIDWSLMSSVPNSFSGYNKVFGRWFWHGKALPRSFDPYPVEVSPNLLQPGETIVPPPASPPSSFNPGPGSQAYKSGALVSNNQTGTATLAPVKNQTIPAANVAPKMASNVFADNATATKSLQLSEAPLLTSHGFYPLYLAKPEDVIRKAYEERWQHLPLEVRQAVGNSFALWLYLLSANSLESLIDPRTIIDQEPDSDLSQREFNQIFSKLFTSFSKRNLVSAVLLLNHLHDSAPLLVLEELYLHSGQKKIIADTLGLETFNSFDAMVRHEALQSYEFTDDELDTILESCETWQLGSQIGTNRAQALGQPGTSGEGTVYRLRDRPEWVAKIFHSRPILKSFDNFESRLSGTALLREQLRAAFAAYAKFFVLKLLGFRNLPESLQIALVRNGDQLSAALIMQFIPGTLIKLSLISDLVDSKGEIDLPPQLEELILDPAHVNDITMMLEIMSRDQVAIIDLQFIINDAELIIIDPMQIVFGSRNIANHRNQWIPVQFQILSDYAKLLKELDGDQSSDLRPPQRQPKSAPSRR